MISKAYVIFFERRSSSTLTVFGMQSNVLINDTLHACLADFGLSEVSYNPDTVNVISLSSISHGSGRWMAPELIMPEDHVGIEHARYTPETDIYSLSMLMWEVSQRRTCSEVSQTLT